MQTALNKNMRHCFHSLNLSGCCFYHGVCVCVSCDWQTVLQTNITLLLLLNAADKKSKAHLWLLSCFFPDKSSLHNLHISVNFSTRSLISQCSGQGTKW